MRDTDGHFRHHVSVGPEPADPRIGGALQILRADGVADLRGFPRDHLEVAAPRKRRESQSGHLESRPLALVPDSHLVTTKLSSSAMPIVGGWLPPPSNV